MSKVGIICANCFHPAMKESGAVNRSKAKDAPIYCGKACAGIARRRPADVTKADLVAAKAEYDRLYREKNAAMLKAKKAEYYAANADREKEREARQRRMPMHVEYCRRPEYRKWKADYDQQYRAAKFFGDFGEAAIILNQLEAEINTRISWIERRRQNGTLNKSLERKRDYARQTGRPLRG